MDEEKKSASKYTLHTKDGHYYVVSFDSFENPIVKEVIRNIQSKTSGNVVSEDIQISLDNTSQIINGNKPYNADTGLLSSFHNMLAKVVYLMKKTGRPASLCKAALIEAKWSVEEALNILSKNRPGY